MKKWIAMILCVVLAMSLFAGCAGNSQVSYEDHGGEVTLKMAIPFAAQKDLSLVQDEINKLLAQKLPNTKLELTCDQAMDSKWSLWIAGKTSFDIVHSGYAMDITNEASKKSFLPLDELVNQYAPSIKKEWEETYTELYWTGEYNDKLYAIPAVQSYVDKTRTLTISGTAAKYLDTNAIIEATKATPHISEAVYMAVDQCLRDATAAGIHIEVHGGYLWKNCPAAIGYVFVGGLNSNICYDPFAESFQMMDWHQTETFQTYMKWVSKWYKEGFINKDVMAGGVPKEGEGTATICIGNPTDNINFNGGDIITDDDGSLTVRIQRDEHKVKASHNIGELQTYFSIPATAKNPARAMKFLELIRTPEGADILNMLAFGIEGTHYEKLSDSYIKAFDYEGQGSSSSKYGLPAWMMGNMLNGLYTVYPMPENVTEYAKKYYTEILPSRKTHALYGFSFDLSSLNVQMTNIRSTNAELEAQIGYGVASDPQKALENLTNNLKKAGMDMVIETLQKQAEAYIASNQ